MELRSDSLQLHQDDRGANYADPGEENYVIFVHICDVYGINLILNYS